MSQNPAEDQPALDKDQFVGEPPAGDASPGEFTSNDQSADATSAEPSDESSDEPDSEDDQ